MTAHHQCYGCKNVFEYEDLAYECMCFHDEAPTHRGIRINCASTKTDSIQVPAGHNLKKIHNYSEKNKEFFNMLETEYPMWGGIFTTGEDEHITVSYRETSDGARDRESIHACYHAGVQTILKTVDFQDFHLSDFQCTCCS